LKDLLGMFVQRALARMGIEDIEMAVYESKPGLWGEALWISNINPKRMACVIQGSDPGIIGKCEDKRNRCQTM